MGTKWMANERELTDKLLIPVWVTDEEGRIVYCNRVFEFFYVQKYGRKISPFEDIKLPLTEILGIEWNKLIKLINKKERRKFEIQINFRNKEYYYEIDAIENTKDDSHKKFIYFLAYNITDRKKSIGILHKAKVQLQSLINNIPALVWLKDAKGEIVVCNQKFKEFFGWKNDFLCSEKKSLLPEKSEILDYLFDDRYIIEFQKHFFEEKLFNINQENRWFEIHKTPIFSESGEYIGTSGIAQEITQRKIIENILLDSEEKFRQFAENTSDAFILSNHKGILYINPEFEKIFGRKVHEGYKHKHIPGDWIFPDDREKVVNYFNSEDFILTGKFNGQYRVVHPDGNIVWVWERVFPVKDDKGEIIRYISVISDITRQKQLEAELLITHAQQQAILDNIPHMAWLKDINGKYISVNEAFARHYKRHKDEIVGLSDNEITDPDTAELHAYNDYLVINSKQSQTYYEFIDTPSGTVYSETIKTPVFDNEGNVIGITGISIDITPYKRMELQLRANDDRIKALLLHSTESITVVDTEGRVIFDTSYFYKIAGIKSEEAIGRPFTEFVSPSDEGLVLYAINKVIENPDVQQEAIYACVKPNGTIVYFESFFSNHIDNQLIKGIVINSRDITEKKLAETKEIAYQQRVSFLEKTALDFLSISSSNEIYRYIGENIRELVPNSVVIFSSYNEENDALVIKHLSGLNKYMGVVYDILGRDPINYALPLSKTLKRKLIISSNKLHELNGGLYNITNRQIDFMVCKALEKLISLNKSYGMGIVRSGKLLGSVIILTRYEQYIEDPRIIETFLYQASIALLRRKLEKELIRAKERAEESDRLKTAFLANMSHEIRTPINGILGFSQLLEHSFDDPEKREEFIQIIRTNANLLLNLIDDIIDVSRIQEGQVKLKKTIVNINLLLDDILTPYMNPVSQGKDIITKIEKSLPDEEAIVLADPLRLKQILNNLISNAFKFTEKGSITVGYSVDKDMIVFYVADTGIGIPENKREEIFQRFTQADVSLTRRYGGSGLGLAISKGLVELMGGKIWVESTEGIGSKFYFTIPGLYNSKSPLKTLSPTIKNNLMIN
ncbi:MAG: PAS domain S-box protein [Bacteroidales bacterium]|nr:PAS domain S-box protein [Bacteroidales bacterium]